MKILKHDYPLAMPKPNKNKEKNPISINGQARAAGIDPCIVHSRLRYGWTLEEALKTPVMTRAESASKAGLASRRSARARKINKSSSTEGCQ